MRFVKNVLSQLGIVVQRKQPWMDNYTWLVKHNIKTVLDIGANTGNFAAEYAALLPQATIYSFEPIPSVYKQLVETTKGLNVKTFNYGLGDKTETLSINVNEFSPSSSILELADLHKDNFKNALKTNKETISIKELDKAFSIADFEKNILVKIDVQGFEDKAINGAKAIMAQCKLVLIEMTFKELYKDQKLFHDIYLQLHALGFDYNGSLAQNFDKEDGSIIYCDALFINRNL